MREVTEGELQKFLKEVEKNITEEGVEFNKERGIYVPRWVVRGFEGMVRFYEASDVQDVTENYAELTKKSLMPARILLWVCAKYCTNNKFRQFVNLSEGEPPDYEDLTRDCAESFRHIVRFCTLDNVCLEELVFFNWDDRYSICKFQIKDKYDWSVPGTYVLKNPRRSQEQNEEARKEIEQVVASHTAQTFDIQFEALDENYEVSHQHKKAPRGKMLHVYSIHKARGEREFLEPPQESTKTGPGLLRV